MKHLRTLDPLKAIKGKLNFLHFQNQPFFQLLHLANTFSRPSVKQGQESSLNNISLQEIQSLGSSSNAVSAKDAAKMKFQAHVHKNSNLNQPIGTVYEELSKHQKRLVSTLLNFSDKLNAKQIEYLHYSMRKKLNAIYPNWQNLHWNPESPFKRQFLLSPNLSSVGHLYDLKLLPKKNITPLIISTRPVVAGKTEQAEPVAAPAAEPEKAKGKKGK